jgi:serine/threonine-protein kinase
VSIHFLQPGDVVADKYQVRALLGRGGMGSVYLVRHAITGKRLALKFLSGAMTTSSTAGKRLVREAIAAGRIEHRNVVNVFDLGEHQGSAFLVMEYLEGRSLRQIMDERTHSDRELLRILLGAMDGVRAAHAQGVIHRDLKPDNIFVCKGPSGRYDDPKVLDFGIARLPHSDLTDLTNVGLTLGSPFYMSFEQLQGARDLDGRADLYALGVIVYQTLTGRRPFDGQTLAELTSKIASGKPPPTVSELRPDLPKGLSAVVMRAIARDRIMRQPDVGTLISELAPFVDRLPDTVSVHAAATPRSLIPVTAFPTPLPVPPRARAALQLAIAATAAFVITLGGISLLRTLTRGAAPPPKTAASLPIKGPALQPAQVVESARRLPSAPAPRDLAAGRDAVVEDSADVQPVSTRLARPKPRLGRASEARDAPAPAATPSRTLLEPGASLVPQLPTLSIDTQDPYE